MRSKKEHSASTSQADPAPQRLLAPGTHADGRHPRVAISAFARLGVRVFGVSPIRRIERKLDEMQQLLLAMNHRIAELENRLAGLPPEVGALASLSTNLQQFSVHAMDRLEAATALLRQTAADVSGQRPTTRM